jgi:hypothetical protein
VGFFVPSALALGLSLVVLVAIYLRHRSRPLLEVSSLTLFEPTAAPAVRSRVLRLDPLFWFDAACLTALTLLAAGLYVHETRPAPRPQRHALIFDLGASMGATDGRGDRLAEAQQQALALLDHAAPAQEFSIITYALEATRVAARSNRRSDLREAILALRPEAVTPGQTALGAALSDAASADEIDLFTDHRPPPRLLDAGHLHGVVHLHLVGSPGANLAIVALDPGVPRNLEGYCLVRSFADVPRTTELAIDLDRRPVFHSPLMLEPRAQMTVRFGPLPQGGVLHARLLQPDDLAVDNDRYALAPSVAPATALVVSNDRGVRDDLARVLLAINPNFRVTAIDASAAALRQQSRYRFDLAVLHEVDPSAINAAARMLIYPQPRSAAGLEVTGSVPMAELRRGNTSLGNPVLLGPARIVQLPAWMEPLATGAPAGSDTSIPLIATGTPQSGPVGLIAFDLRNHLLLNPDKMAALLATIDAVRQLLQPTDARVVQTGKPVPLALFAPATLIAPDGSRTALRPDSAGIAYFNPLETGRYLAVSGHRMIAIYANYFDATESDLEASSQVLPAHAPTPELAAVRTTIAAVPQDRLLALVVALLLLAESWVIVRTATRGRSLHV